MKIRCTNILLVTVMLFIVSSMSAQFVRISAFGQEGAVIGEMAKKEINNPSAGYAEYGSVGGLEANYYLKNNLGFGIRWSGRYYARDFETYESDLIDLLAITNEPYDVAQRIGYWDFGTDLGISYLLDLSGKWQMEPYFYFGFRLLASPPSSVIYYQNSTTFQYKSKPQLFVGASYSPGIKFHWTPLNHLGFYVSLEYNGNSFLEGQERSMVYSFDSLDLTDTEKKYSIHSVYLGLGTSISFGKGLSRQD